MSAAADIACVSSEFDIFAHRHVEISLLGTIENAYKPFGPVDQKDLEFFIPANNDTYIYLDIKLYVRGKLVSASGKDEDFTDLTSVTNNFLHSLVIQCNVTLNGVTITQVSEPYHYRSYLEILLTYGTDSVATHLSNAYWYLDTGDLQPSVSTAEKLTATTNRGGVSSCDF